MADSIFYPMFIFLVPIGALVTYAPLTPSVPTMHFPAVDLRQPFYLRVSDGQNVFNTPMLTFPASSSSFDCVVPQPGVSFSWTCTACTPVTQVIHLPGYDVTLTSTADFGNQYNLVTDSWSCGGSEANATLTISISPAAKDDVAQQPQYPHRGKGSMIIGGGPLLGSHKGHLL